MTLKIFTATIRSGKKEGAYFTKLPWVQKQIKEKLGFTPYPGTLNLKLPKNIKREDLLPSTKTIEIKPEEGFMLGKCFKAVIMGRIEGAIILPEVSNYPSDLIEFIAPINLRKALKLRDNDCVEIMIL
jgi:CTP-dependent riboflavin kinase